jgi:hypothetical protein
LQALPPMLSRRAKQLSGPLHGIWIHGVHPLQVPSICYDSTVAGCRYIVCK